MGWQSAPEEAVDAAIEESKEANIVLERRFPKAALYQTVFKLARAAILVCALSFGRRKHHAGEVPALLLVSSFMIYAAVVKAGGMSSIARAVELDRLDNILDIHPWTKTGADLVPEISISK